RIVGNSDHRPLAQGQSPIKRVAIVQSRLSRFRSLFLRMSLSQNRSTVLRDMLSSRDVAKNVAFIGVRLVTRVTHQFL
ncbi:hypothetical protein ACCS96_34865, partial [Rhizobium ruizarguesonis]